MLPDTNFKVQGFKVSQLLVGEYKVNHTLESTYSETVSYQERHFVTVIQAGMNN